MGNAELIWWSLLMLVALIGMWRVLKHPEDFGDM